MAPPLAGIMLTWTEKRFSRPPVNSIVGGIPGCGRTASFHPSGTASSRSPWRGTWNGLA